MKVYGSSLSRRLLFFSNDKQSLFSISKQGADKRRRLYVDLSRAAALLSQRAVLIKDYSENHGI